MVRTCAVLGLAWCLTACASGYSQFYTDYSAGGHGIAPATKAPQIVNVPGSADDVVFDMFTNGYTIVGESSFNGTAEDTSGALAQAKKVGAEYVVLRSDYTHTVSGSIPMTTIQTVTSTSTGTASAYGTGGMATGNYRGTTTTTVPNTTYIPYSVSRYDQLALYFAPMAEACIGFYQVDLTDGEKSMLGTNKGYRIAAVRKGSPAFNSDILPLDYVMTLDGRPFTEQTPLPKRGQVVEFGLVRNGERVTVKLEGGNGCEP